MSSLSATRDSTKTRAYLIGGGIASLASAVYLIRDGHISGENITVFDESAMWGGSLDAAGSASSGYYMRGGRMFEEHFVCTYDLLSGIPSLNAPNTSAKDDIFDFFREASWYSHSRLIDKDARIVDFSVMELSLNDKLALMHLMATPEKSLATKRIEEMFEPHFFQTNFWLMWCTMFAFEPWHSAIEMKRYLLRFIHLFPTIHTMSGIYTTRYTQYDSMVRPIVAWLQNHHVHFEGNTRITDLDIESSGATYTVRHIDLLRNGRKDTLTIDENDIVIMTNGSMTAASSWGTMHSAPVLNEGDPGGAWTLWSTIARDRPAFGNPKVFSGQIDKSKWESFTVTTTHPDFPQIIEEFTHSKLGQGALVTLKDSNWLLTVNFYYNPKVADQPKEVFLWWGYGLFPDRVGNYVQKKMSECTGEEILTEVFSHLHFGDKIPSLIASTACIPCMMPYITSQFMPRSIGDRPEVVPQGSTNLAFVGQYAEVPDDVVFTVEYSVRTAQTAVYSLLGLHRKPLPMYQGKYDMRVLLAALKTSNS